MTKKIAKLILMGDGYVGKTTLRKRFMGENFNTEYMVTIGADFAVKSIQEDDDSIVLQIWDLAGQEQFALVRDRYYRNATGAIMVFDLTNRKTYENIPLWMNEFTTNTVKPIVPIVLLGNKSDLITEIGREVSEEEVNGYLGELQSWGKSLDPNFEITYLETSAKFGQNVEEAFHSIIRMMSI